MCSGLDLVWVEDADDEFSIVSYGAYDVSGGSVYVYSYVAAAGD